VLRDRGFMKNALERAWAAGVRTLVFTVDMPVPGARYRDRHSGMSGPFAAWRRMLQAVTHPRWAWDVGLRGRPHVYVLFVMDEKYSVQVFAFFRFFAFLLPVFL
jgi:L-lactate dehydrogenase (cytochrome)